MNALIDILAYHQANEPSKKSPVQVDKVRRDERKEFSIMAVAKKQNFLDIFNSMNRKRFVPKSIDTFLFTEELCITTPSLHETLI